MPAAPQSVCVVIPCYRLPLTPFEVAALERCAKILGRHPIAIVKPTHLNVDDLLVRHPSFKTESLDDEYFEGVAGYNRMMLSESFYARFSQYEYVLIYQLDAFVFSDQLLAWCDKGYDYIGAPWLPRSAPLNFPGKLRATTRRILYRLLDRKDRDGVGLHHAQYDYCSGNGGFSLRRVAKMRTVLRDLHARAEPYRRLTHHSYSEDIFFCVEANRYRRWVTTPSLQEAVKFSWESHPKLAAQLNKGELPFGCHAWNRLYRDEWRPLFAKLGYSLDVLLDEKPQATKANATS